jgi:hypothetical protein
MQTKIESLLTLAGQLPSGLKDPLAEKKMEQEIEEMGEAAQNDDYLGEVLEAADVAYYAIKAEANGLLDEALRDKIIYFSAGFVNLQLERLLDCAIAKYALRARPGNPKDDEAERAAVRQLLDSFSINLYFESEGFNTIRRGK